MRDRLATLIGIALLPAVCNCSSSAAHVIEEPRADKGSPAIVKGNNSIEGTSSHRTDLPIRTVTIPTSPWTTEQLKECPKSISVSTVDYVSCTVCSNGSTRCWGDVANRVLSTEVDEHRSNLVGAQQISGISDAVSVSTNSLVACVLHKGGSVSCWGSWKQTSIPFVADFVYGAIFEVPLPTPAISVAVGYENACALLQTGEVICWGDNHSGQCGVSYPNGGVADRVTVPRLRAKRIALGGAISCAIDLAGRVWCWGFNDGGALGTGDSLPRTGPVRIEELENVVELYANAGHVCAQTANEDVWCWGSDDLSYADESRPRPTQRMAPTGQLVNVGVDSFNIATPDGGIRTVSLEDDTFTEVPSLSGVQSMSAYRNAHCAITVAGELLCWGGNTYGQLILRQKTPEAP